MIAEEMIKQIKDALYVSENNPQIHHHWLRYLLEEREKYKRLHANTNEELDALHTQIAEKDKVLRHADNEIETVRDMLREDAFDNAEDTDEILWKVNRSIGSILSRYAQSASDQVMPEAEQ